MNSELIVYVVGPHESMGRALAALLKTYDIQVECYTDAQSFLKEVPSHCAATSCLLLALDLPDSGGLSLLHQLSQEPHLPPIIAVGTDVDERQRQQVREAGATDVIEYSLAASYLFTRLAEIQPGASNLRHTVPSTMELDDGTPVTFRMMHPEDAEMEQAFVIGLSERSKYLRFFSGLEKLPKSVLKTFTHPEFPISYAVIATIPWEGRERQVGVARYAPTGTDGVAEFAVVVADQWQGHGVAGQLMRLLVTAAAVGGVSRLEGLILKENSPMLAMAEKMGFSLCPDHEAGPSVALYALELRGSTGEPE